MIVYEGLHARGVLSTAGDAPALTAAGAAWLASFGIDAAREAVRHRAFCRACLDWGERRHHLGGALGAALLRRLYELGWASRAKDSRIVTFTPKAEQELRFAFAA